MVSYFHYYKVITERFKLKIKHWKCTECSSVLNCLPRMPSCPTCLRCLRALRALRAYVLYLLMFLKCLRAFVSLPLKCLPFLRASRPLIFMSLNSPIVARHKARSSQQFHLVHHDFKNLQILHLMLILICRPLIFTSLNLYL